MKIRPLVVLYRASLWVTILSLLASSFSWAATGFGPVTIVAPPNGALVGGSNVGVTAQFDTGGKKVDTLRLYIDGQAYQSVRVGPSQAGSGTFPWNSARFADGNHELMVELLTRGASLARASVMVTVNNGAMDVVPPTVSFYGVKDGQVVAGETRVSMVAADNVGVTYVQLFIDDNVKLITNTQPFSYTWDTTTVANGAHTLKASAFDLADNKGFSRAITVMVNNPVAAVLSAVINPDPVAPAPAVKAPEAPTTPPVVSVAAAPKNHIEIADQSVPALVAPGPAPTVAYAAPRVEEPSIPAPTKPSMVASAAPRGHLGIHSSRAAEPVSIPAPVRMATAPRFDVTPSDELPRAVPMAEARVAASPRLAPGMSASAPMPAEIAPSVAESRPAAAPARRAKAVRPAVRMAKAQPVLSSEMPPPPPSFAPAPRKAVKVNLKSVEAPELVVPSDKPAAPAAKAPAHRAKAKAVRVAALPRVSNIDNARATCLYVVKPGDDVARIAAKTHIPADTVRKAAGSAMTAGTQLRIPMGIHMVLDREDLKELVAPRTEKGVTMAPLRQIVERAGGSVAWDSDRQRVYASRGFDQVILEIGSDRAKVNGITIVMAAAPYLEEGRTLVPLRFVENSLAIEVQFDPETNTIYMTSL